MRYVLIPCLSSILISLACGGTDSTPTPVVPAPTTPAGLVATPGNRQVVLSWTASKGATSYHVKRLSTGGFLTVASPATNTYTDTGLINGASYQYEVSAVNSGGESAVSSAVTGDLTSQASCFSATPDWADEFEQADGSAPDGTKWDYDLGYLNVNSELETYTNRSANIQILNNCLDVIALKETYTNPQDNITKDYTSARLITKGKHSQKYGRIEARIQLPGGQGIWPAFWMVGDNIGSIGWPTCGEIDIMENIGNEPAINHGSLHGLGYSGGSSLSGNYALPDGAFSAGFHTFRLDWVENLMQFYVDDNLYETRAAADAQARGGNWAFNHPFFIIINTAVGGGWPGDPDDTTVFPQHMYVDYVRIYNLK